MDGGLPNSSSGGGALLDWVAELLAEVEQQGAWPRDLCRGETVLLPKGGTSDPLDRRPITLLPVLYRMWAALRATQFRAWLKECGVPPLDAGRNGTMRSAEHQGLLLADWSKCYDHLGFDLVAGNFRAAGILRWFTGPLLAMYMAPRHIRVDGAMGQVRTPARCIPPGCPAAVDVLALLTLPWIKQARMAHSPGQARGWVDDLTWW